MGERGAGKKKTASPPEDPVAQSELVEAEESARRSREEAEQARILLQSVLDAIPDLIGIQKTDHTIVSYNKAGYEMLGIGPARAQGRKCYEIIGRSSACPECASTSALLHRRPSRIEKYAESLGIWLECRSYPVLDSEGRVTYIVEHLRDITAFKKASEELRIATERTAHSQKMEAIGQLAGGVAHDFNNQLMGILGNAELIRLEVEPEHEISKMASNIILASKRAADLTAKLLAFARKGKHFSVVVDLHKIVMDVAAILKHSIDKRIEIRHRLHAAPSTFRGDPALIQNAVLNLGINARDAMPDGGVLEFSTSIEHVAEGKCCGSPLSIKPGKYIKLRVSDTGVGIAPSTMARIFEPFFTTKDSGKGTGMGLPSVLGAVESHSGAISATSEPGRGAEFDVCLPLYDARSDSHTPSEPTAIRRPSRKLRILLAEDEPIVAETALTMLRKMGHFVVSRSDGANAVEEYRKNWREYDLVILDMVMPVMSGRDAYLEMRRINPSVAAILCSGYSMDSGMRKIISSGVKGFLQKPFTTDELASIIELASD